MSEATDRMAAQLAELVTTSDRAELLEIVERWRKTAPTPGQRAVMDRRALAVHQQQAAGGPLPF